LFRPIQPIPIELKLFTPYSGFDSVEEWIDEIKKLNKADDVINYTGEVYCVYLINSNDELVSKYINGELN